MNEEDERKRRVEKGLVIGEGGDVAFYFYFSVFLFVHM